MTPASVHTGQAADILVKRNHVLQAAFTDHPERFKGQPPSAPPLPEAAWINPPPKSKPEETPPSISNDSHDLHELLTRRVSK